MGIAHPDPPTGYPPSWCQPPLFSIVRAWWICRDPRFNTAFTVPLKPAVLYDAVWDICAPLTKLKIDLKIVTDSDCIFGFIEAYKSITVYVFCIFVKFLAKVTLALPPTHAYSFEKILEWYNGVFCIMYTCIINVVGYKKMILMWFTPKSYKNNNELFQLPALHFPDQRCKGKYSRTPIYRTMVYHVPRFIGHSFLPAYLMTLHYT